MNFRIHISLLVTNTHFLSPQVPVPLGRLPLVGIPPQRPRRFAAKLYCKKDKRRPGRERRRRLMRSLQGSWTEN